MPDVKFSIIIEERTIDIHLNNVCPDMLFIVFARILSLLDDTIEFVYLVNNCYSFPLIGILPWLYNPDISHLFAFIDLLLLLFFYPFLSLFIILSKPFILRVFETILDVKSERNIFEDIFILFSIEGLKIIE